jgi:hypothetical protein
MKFVARVVGGLGLLLVALVLLAPGALYFVGLYGIEGMPSKPAVMEPSEAQRWAWHELRGQGNPKSSQ